MPAPSSLLAEERDFVVDSRVSMHMLSKKCLNSDEKDTLRRSRYPTVVMIANAEVQTFEEAQIAQSRFGIIRDCNYSLKRQ